MRRRSRTRRVLKWAGTVVCVLIVVLSVWSGWYFVRFSPTMAFKQDWLAGERIPNNYEGIYIVGGNIKVRWVRWSERKRFAIRNERPAVGPEELEELPALWVWKLRNPASFHLWPPWFNDANPSQPAFLLPLWIPLLLVLIPTVFLWRFDRRIPPTHCQRCGYDLRNLPEPRCPECGTAFEREGDTG